MKTFYICAFKVFAIFSKPQIKTLESVHFVAKNVGQNYILISYLAQMKEKKRSLADFQNPINISIFQFSIFFVRTHTKG